MDHPLKLIILDDEQDFREGLVDFFKLSKMNARCAASTDELTTLLETFSPDIILVDTILGEQSGLEVVQTVRKRTTAGIILLSNLDAVDIQVAGLEVGADAYLTKETDRAVIKATIEALARRIPQTITLEESSTKPTAWYLQEQDWTLVAPNQIVIDLNQTEKSLLQNLMQARGEIVSRSALLSESGREDTIENQRYLDVIIQRLRKKTREQAALNVPIKTVYGKGYVFLFE